MTTIILDPDILEKIIKEGMFTLSMASPKNLEKAVIKPYRKGKQIAAKVFFK